MAKWSFQKAQWKLVWKKPAFTLIECLAALFVLAMIMLLLNPRLTHSIKVQEQLNSYRDQEFEIGLLQFSKELQGLNFLANGERVIKFYRDTPTAEIDFKVVNQVFIKRENNGYQPLITKVKGIKVKKNSQSIMIAFTFTDGSKRYGKVPLVPPIF